MLPITGRFGYAGAETAAQAMRAGEGVNAARSLAGGQRWPDARYLRAMTGRFGQAMRLMRRHDAQLQDDGFHLLLPHAAEHVEELLAEFTSAGGDHGLRCWLLELIGHARSPAALPMLVDQLNGDDTALRWWAARGLQKLNNKPARLALWKARTNGLID